MATAFANGARAALRRPPGISALAKAGCRPAAGCALATLVRPVGGLLPAAVGEKPAMHVVSIRVRRVVVEREPTERVDARPATRDPKRVSKPACGRPAGHPEGELVVGVVGGPEQRGQEKLDAPAAARLAEVAIDPACEQVEITEVREPSAERPAVQQRASGAE